MVYLLECHGLYTIIFGQYVPSLRIGTMLVFGGKKMGEIVKGTIWSLFISLVPICLGESDVQRFCW